MNVNEFKVVREKVYKFETLTKEINDLEKAIEELKRISINQSDATMVTLSIEYGEPRPLHWKTKAGGQDVIVKGSGLTDWNIRNILLPFLETRLRHLQEEVVAL